MCVCVCMHTIHAIFTPFAEDLWQLLFYARFDAVSYPMILVQLHQIIEPIKHSLTFIWIFIATTPNTDSTAIDNKHWNLDDGYRAFAGESRKNGGIQE